MYNPSDLLPHLVVFPKIGDSSLGYISVAEAQDNVPFEIKRVYWTYFTPDEVERGGHAHRELEQIIFAVGGRIDFFLESLAGEKQHFVLEKPNIGLYIPKLYWREIRFSHNAVLLCLASEHYTEADYFREYKDFKNHAL